MRVALYQMDVTWLDPDKNLEKIKSICREIQKKADLLILPEMFSVGYVLDTSLINQDWQLIVIQKLWKTSLTFNKTSAIHFRI